MQSCEMGHICDKYDSQRGLHRSTSSRILVSFGESITLIRAETERYEAARFSRVTTKICLGKKVLTVKSIQSPTLFSSV